MAAAPVMGKDTPPVGTTVIDLVLGYTSGFAANLGGTSAAVTRLNFLVDVVNQSYVNSQIAAQVRLVHTLQVSYPDATANSTTLEELTGYRSGTGFITPNPAFDALRAARDQYGADLVSLVRKFNDPENDGCGIAWLIGGAQSGIDANDEPFGYSVVSDGTDVGSDGKTYFCREETLAHEMGHNMGSQHDRATAMGTDGVLDAKDYGVFPYSFGYKTTSGAGNFFTIMAYGDTGQARYRVFSNPRITFCGGFACGINNQADNALSLSNTIPTVARFRSSVVANPPPPTEREIFVCSANRSDFDGGARSDILWRHMADGWNVAWKAANSGTPKEITPVPSQHWQVAGLGDFDGDGQSDIFWRHAIDGWNVAWKSGNSATPLESTPVPSQTWQVAAIGDFDGDGRSDIFWRHMVDGWNVIWRSGNSAAVTEVTPVPSQVWRLVGVGDFNGDGQSDLLWRHMADGWNVIWRSANSNMPTEVTVVPSQIWQVAGVGDFDGDHRSDILWRHSGDGWNVIWRSGNSALPREVTPVASQIWQVVGVADFNGDGASDILWRHMVDGWNVAWRSANSATPQEITPVPSQIWQVAGLCRRDAFAL